MTHIERLGAALEGRYRIERELGEGGMATVYLAEDVRHGRKVAVKVLRPELAAVVGAERFLAEIRTTAALQHPHILPLHDSGEAGGFLFYVMPYVEGESLRDRLDRERQLPVEEAVELARKVADALQYAHEQGVVHRDVKPANILLSRGNPLVADFGIALAVSQAGGGRITETGLSLGTPHYMSPEQASGERTVDRRSDVYSLGCVLYEMLTGEPPHGGPTSQAVLARILTAEPQRVSRLRRTVPPHVDAAVAKALEKLPADRFATAEDFRSAVADPSFRHATTPAPAARTAPGTGRSRWLSPGVVYAMAGLLILLLVVLALVDGSGWGAASSSRPTVRFSLDLGENPVTRSELDLSPDGSMLVYASGGGKPLYLRAMDELESRPVPGTEGALWPVFSPDGRWIAYMTEDGIRKIPVAGGSPVPVTLEADGRLGLHWGDDGSLVYFEADGLYRVSAQGGEAERILEGSLLTFRFPRMLPGGEALLFTEMDRVGPDARGRIRLLDLESGEITTVVPEGSDARYVESGHIVYGRAGGTLFAIPFDLERREVAGSPFPVLDGVRVMPGFGAAAFAASRVGTVAYAVNEANPGILRTLVLVDSSGRREPVPLDPAALLSSPRLSPDGRRVAYQRQNQIYVYDLLVGSNTLLLSEGFNQYPVWTPGGDSVVFKSSRERVAMEDLASVTLTGEAPPALLLAEEGIQIPESWTPDGRRLLYTSIHLDNEDLRVLDLGGDALASRPYLAADWDESRGRISPDGRWVAYDSDESGTTEIYVRAFPEPGEKLQVSRGGGRSSRWSPDGRTLYYWHADTLVAAGVAIEPSLQVLSRSDVLVESYGVEYDVRPDGNGFVFSAVAPSEADAEDGREAGTSSAGGGNLIVVVNWFGELRRRAGETGG